jgi:hypothetical protein
MEEILCFEVLNFFRAGASTVAWPENKPFANISQNKLQSNSYKIFNFWSPKT